LSDTIDSRLLRFAEAMPKAELHVHLEGAIAPATLLELARRRRVSLPADTEEGLRQWYRFEDFEHFVDIYVTCSECLYDPEDFQFALRAFAAEQARQNIVYSEVHFTISTHVRQGANAGEVADAMGETLVEVERDLGTRVRLIPDIVRNLEPEWADVTLEWALDNRERGVVALGIAGIESWSARPFREHFEAAAAEGLHRVAHAGEQCGPESIHETLAVAAPERLGHGIRAVEDEELLADLAARALPVEVCPTSNVALGNAPSLAEHPIGRMLEAGIDLSVNSDDPAMFDTTLSREYALVGEHFDLDHRALAKLTLAPLRHSFLEPSERERFERDFRCQLSELAGEIYESSLDF
jgi:adenosine deaminase